MKRKKKKKKRQRSKVHGFRRRMASAAGRKVLKARRNKYHIQNRNKKLT